MSYKFNTLAIHQESEFPYQSTTQPIVASSSFKAESAEELEKIFEGKSFGYLYSRVSNPTVVTLEQKVTAIENGLGAVAVSSGMAAITTSLLSLLSSGDHLLVSTSLFGGTFTLLNKIFTRFGIEIDFVDCTNLELIRTHIKNSTKAVFIETIGNPKLDVLDIQAISKIVHSFGLPLFVDNTLASPYLLQLKSLGADVIIYSMTKFFSAPSTTIGGIIIDTGNFDWNNSHFPELQLAYKTSGEFAFLSHLRSDTIRNFGPTLSPFSAFLILNGLETLGIRMERASLNALHLAKYLNSNNSVAWVNYPGIKTNRFYNIAKSQFGDKFGALLTFGTGSKEKSFAVINKLKIVKNLANLGDTGTLVIHPSSTIYHDFSESEKQKIGVSEDLIRVSVGLEDIEDIIEDFKQALSI